MFLGRMAFRRFPDANPADGVPPTPVTKDGKVIEPVKVEPTQVDTTKAFSKRLAQEKVRLAAEEREKIAKENGFNSYEEMRVANQNQKIKESTHIDPLDEDFQKALDIIQKGPDPEKEDLKAKVKGYEESEAEKWEREQVALLKTTYGIDIKSLTELDPEVTKRIEKGIDPVDAYYLVHKPSPKKPEVDDKAHLKNDPHGSGGGDKETLTKEELDVLKEYLPDLTEAEIIEKVKKDRESKKK